MRSAVIVIALMFTMAGVNAQKPDTSWIKDFRAFRDAVYQGNKAKAKTFVDFTKLGKDDDIWSVIHWYDEGEYDPKPFNEKEFDQNFHKIFPKRLINGILKVKSAELGKNGYCETMTFKEGDTNTYQILATADYQEKTFTLNLSITTYVKNKKGVVEFGGESSIVYVFAIVDKSKLKLRQISLAG